MTLPGNKLIPVLAKIFITLGLVSLVYSQIDLRNVISKFISVDTTLLIYAFICHIIAYGLLATRYVYLLQLLTTLSDYLSIFKWYYFGLFCNNYLPTSIGGDVVRIYVLRKHNLSLENLIVSSFADRLLGFSSIILMGFVAIFFNPLLLTINSEYLVMLALAMLAFLVVGLVSLKMLLNYRKSEHGLVYKFVQKIGAITRIFKTYRHKRSEILIAFFISFIAQLLILLCYSLLGFGLDLKVGFFSYFAIIPVVFLTSAIPITVGGLGIREGTLISLLSLYSVSYDDAAALSLLYLMIITVITLPAILLPLFKDKNMNAQISMESK